jgi:tetratricopeptide (TPR) repeat protein
MQPYVAVVFVAWLQTAPQVPAAFQKGYIEYLRGHLRTAEQLYVESLRELPQNDATNRANAFMALGDIYTRLEDYGKAEDAYSQSLSLWQRLDDARSSALLLHNLGMLRAYQGRSDEALRLVMKALETIQSASPGDPAITAQILNGIGVVHYQRNDNGKAEKFFNQVLEVVRTSNISFNTAGVLNNLGAVYLNQHKFKQAEDNVNRALKMKEEEESQSDPDLIPELSALGAIYSETGKYAQAEAQYKRALQIAELQGSDFAPKAARSLYSLTSLYAKMGRRSDSQTALSDAAKIARENLNKDPDMVQIVEDYSKLLRSRGNVSEAADLQAEAKHARMLASLVVRVHP